MNATIKFLKDCGLNPRNAENNALKNIEEAHVKCDFIYNRIIKKSAFHELVDKSKRLKSNEVSLKYRTEGNNAYIRDKKYLEAVILYTQSIANAQSDCPEVGLAYGNRSAVLFHKEYYMQCIEDIDQAIQNNYPEDKKEKLLMRQNKAILLKDVQKSVKYGATVPEIKNKNTRIAVAGDCVEIKTWKNRQRIVATKAIELGDVISAEKPFVYNISRERKYLHCHECFHLCYTLIPCQNCTTALYCSKLCMEQAYIAYHKYECEIQCSLLLEEIIPLRMAIIILTRKLDYDDTDCIYRSDRSKEILEMAVDYKLLSKIPFLEYRIATLTCVAYHCLKNQTQFFSDCAVDEINVKQLLYKCFMISIKHNSAIKSASDPFTQRLTRIGTGIYPFSSLPSHSCVANCIAIWYGQHLVLRAIATIKEGEECTVTFKEFYFAMPREERRFVLLNGYHFRCTCKACRKNWPVCSLLPQRNITLEISNKAFASDGYFNTNNSSAEENLKMVLDELKPLFMKLEAMRPSQDMVWLQCLFVRLLDNTGNTLSSF